MIQKLFILFLLLLPFTSIGQNDTVKGDLYFGLWRYGSFYKQPEKLIQRIEEISKSEQRDSLDKTTQDILRIYDILKFENLLYAPYVQLKINNDSILRVYFDKKDYKKIRKYKLKELQTKEMKVFIELKGKKIGDGLIYCEELITVSTLKGQTYEVPRKFAIEDYP